LRRVGTELRTTQGARKRTGTGHDHEQDRRGQRLILQRLILQRLILQRLILQRLILQGDEELTDGRGVGDVVHDHDQRVETAAGVVREARAGAVHREVVRGESDAVPDGVPRVVDGEHRGAGGGGGTDADPAVVELVGERLGQAQWCVHQLLGAQHQHRAAVRHRQRSRQSPGHRG